MKAELMTGIMIVVQMSNCGGGENSNDQTTDQTEQEDISSIETEEVNNENREIDNENEETNVIIDEVNLNESHPVARQQNSEFLDDFYDNIFDYDDNETLHEDS